MRRLRWLALAAFVVAAAGCALLVDTAGLAGGDAHPDGGPDLQGGADGGSALRLDAGPADASDDAPAPPSCPAGRGPSMVEIPLPSGARFCIDSTEVTNADFRAFLASQPGTSTLPAACSFKAGFATTDGGPAGNPVNADWCDAWAFCAWAGKRMCGRIGGGTNAFGDYADATKSEWYYACSHAGAQTYPYGDAFVGGRCNDAVFDAGGTVPVKTAAGCEGGYAGIFDMAGNYWEWENSCNPVDSQPQNDQCRARGGTYIDLDSQTRCDFDHLKHFDPRRSSTNFMGFRCCAGYGD